MPAGLAKWNKFTYDCAYFYQIYCKSIIDCILNNWHLGKLTDTTQLTNTEIIDLVFWCDVSLVISCCPTSITEFLSSILYLIKQSVLIESGYWYLSSGQYQFFL